MEKNSCFGGAGCPGHHGIISWRIVPASTPSEPRMTPDCIVSGTQPVCSEDFPVSSFEETAIYLLIRKWSVFKKKETGQYYAVWIEDL
jgi:hypothetical protein